MPLQLFKGRGEFKHVYHNPPVARLYQVAVATRGNAISYSGALMAFSGARTGRSPKDKRVVREPGREQDIWWGDINIPLEESSYDMTRESAINFLRSQPDVFVIDGFAGWDPAYRIKVRVVCTLPYHALFMRNMLIRPSEEELAEFGDPDWVIYNAGAMPANAKIPGVDSDTNISIHFGTREIVILGTEYAGEMKKGIFTVLHYELPRRGVFSMHCSANAGDGGDTALFFGLSGTGKTTLSADPARRLIGDDEHAWSDEGIFNIEGGCYAKTVNLSPESEPEIYQAIRFGAILENVGYDRESFVVDYHDTSITENTRCSYPIEFIPNAQIPCVGGHPSNVVFLTCDAFGVLPPVSRLSPEQAMYHFISGYTAKVAGTEVGVTEPQATFSACFGAAFLPRHPMRYAELLAERIRKHGSAVWLVNTGWIGGSYGTGNRISLKHTRAIIDAILSGGLSGAETSRDPRFGFSIPAEVPGLPSEILTPGNAWADADAYHRTADRLARMFNENFSRYEDEAGEDILRARPTVSDRAEA